MSMREKMARAMCIAAGIDPDARGYGLGRTMPEGSEYALWEAQLRGVDAALDALLDPTAGMVDAVFGCCDSSGERATFIKMIRAAKDGK